MRWRENPAARRPEQALDRGGQPTVHALRVGDAPVVCRVVECRLAGVSRVDPLAIAAPPVAR